MAALQNHHNEDIDDNETDIHLFLHITIVQLFARNLMLQTR